MYPMRESFVDWFYPRSFLPIHPFNSTRYSRSILALARCQGFPVRKYSRLCSSIAFSIFAIGPFHGSLWGLLQVLLSDITPRRQKLACSGGFYPLNLLGKLTQTQFLVLSMAKLYREGLGYTCERTHEWCTEVDEEPRHPANR